MSIKLPKNQYPIVVTHRIQPSCAGWNPHLFQSGHVVKEQHSSKNDRYHPGSKPLVRIKY